MVCCIFLRKLQVQVAGVILLLTSVIASIIIICKAIKVKRNDNARASAYYQQSREIKAWNQEAKSTYEKNIKAWNESYDIFMQKINTQISKTNSISLKFYGNSNIIYPKYRNLVAMSSICEYLVTGRCTQLTGPDGAYNLYEDEMRKDMIITKLSAILNNLERIRDNQYMLYQQARSIQQTAQSVLAPKKAILNRFVLVL